MADDSSIGQGGLPRRDALLALNRSATAAKLLSGAVHEVNNALQVISGTVEILQGRADFGDPVTKALERVRAQSSRAANALADVLVFTKGSVDESVGVDMRETVTYSLGVRRFAMHRAGLSAHFEPNLAENFVVQGTRSLLQQAVLNLIINAEQALSGSRGMIDVDLTRKADTIELRVSDEGPGVGVVPQERAFDAFVSTKDPWQGAGLGLWAARAIVGAHGGTLTLEERPTGAVFLMRLPAAE
jgi:signal transduction histidine kinase